MEWKQTEVLDAHIWLAGDARNRYRIVKMKEGSEFHVEHSDDGGGFYIRLESFDDLPRAKSFAQSVHK